MWHVSLNPYANTNQLAYVSEKTSIVSDGGYYVEIDDQAAGNYDYDEIGNLIQDNAEEIDEIQRYVHPCGTTAVQFLPEAGFHGVNGKIKAVKRTGSSTKADLYFAYGPDGQRIRKVAVTGSSSDTTWYVRDAQGNPLAIYSPRGMASGPAKRIPPGEGNVLTTISDQKKAINSSGTVAYWEPKVVSYTDYMPFGMQMTGRSGNTSEARFGFNGQEKNDEIYGSGNSMTAEFWQYDARLGRRWNMDPVVKQWASPYESFSSNPLNRIDPKGDTDYKVDNKGRTTKIKGTEDNENDRFIAVGSSGEIKRDKNGNILNPVETFEKGIIEGVKTDFYFNESSEASISSDEKHIKGLVIEVNNKESGVSLFEWYAKHTEVEMGLIHHDLYNNEHIILTSSHHRQTERVSSELITHYLNNTKPSSYTFFEHRHSHPKGRDTWDFHILSGTDKKTRNEVIEFFKGKAEVIFLLWDEGITKDVTKQK